MAWLTWEISSSNKIQFFHLSSFSTCNCFTSHLCSGLSFLPTNMNFSLNNSPHQIFSSQTYSHKATHTHLTSLLSDSLSSSKISLVQTRPDCHRTADQLTPLAPPPLAVSQLWQSQTGRVWVGPIPDPKGPTHPKGPLDPSSTRFRDGSSRLPNS